MPEIMPYGQRFRLSVMEKSGHRGVVGRTTFLRSGEESFFNPDHGKGVPRESNKGEKEKWVEGRPSAFDFVSIEKAHDGKKRRFDWRFRGEKKWVGGT